MSFGIQLRICKAKLKKMMPERAKMLQESFPSKGMVQQGG
jgi:hypothetical protein